MAFPLSTSYATTGDLVRRERETGDRYELYKGELFAMAGGKLPHTMLGINLAAELRDALKDTDCIVLGSDGRVRVPASEAGDDSLHTFPDVSVVCGAPEIVAPADTLLNPSLVAEVVSDSTEAYDRGQKFAFYRRIASLHTYVLVAQDRRAVDVFERGDDGAWTLRDDDGQTVELRRLGVRLSLDALYAKVPLAPEAPLHPTDRPETDRASGDTARGPEGQA